MKLLHISDLHLGKRLNDYSLLEDQDYILKEILKIIDNEKPRAIIIAGDVYDKSIPSAEAVSLFDSFLTSLAKKAIEIFVIAGNHDSAERMSFGSSIFSKSGVHICGSYEGVCEPVSLEDEYGKLNVYMLPFIKPAHVRRFSEGEIESYTDAVAFAVEGMSVNVAERNILVTHQFVTGASRSESEDITVGGTDNVDASVFEPFDYVALGHIHSAQCCSDMRIRYCGTPLKYSFSEAKDVKSATLVELREKGELFVKEIPLVPLREMREIRGKYDEIMCKSFYENTTLPEDYLHITLTDEDDVIDAIGKLRVVYKNLMKLDYDNKRTRATAEIDGDCDVERKSPFDLFRQFYELQNNQPMSEEQEAFVNELIKEVWGGEK